MKDKLTRKHTETLAIQSAYQFCVGIGIKPSLVNLSMVTGFSEESILEILEISFSQNNVHMKDRST
ncbi:hypothetical protein HF072_19740 [Bacillus sp. RO3]|nr:hypothetical protein [Bacillus sp. RO3]